MTKAMMKEQMTNQTMEKNQSLKSSGECMTRSFRGSCGIRALGDKESRAFELSFSSEEPYARWYDATEILSHAEGAIDLTRLEEIGVLLFNHDRDKVCGKVTKVWIENNRGMAQVEFDKDDKSEVIYQKVASGTLKGVSVMYQVQNYEEVKAGETSEEGFVGPCAIARKWTPYEISIVSIPADASVGVGRSNEEQINVPTYGIYERQLEINKNLLEVVKNEQN